jgi:hypothetical protein
MRARPSPEASRPRHCSGLVSLLLLLLHAGCATPVPQNITVQHNSPCAGAAADYSTLHLRYFGTGGFLLEYGTNAILTAPFFSNISFARSILPLPIDPDKGVIDRLLPDLSRVDAILVGHSHYDHLLDLPYIVNSGKTGAPIYGDTNTHHILVRNVTNKVVNIEPDAGTYESQPSKGAWVTNANRRLRFMAFRSMHAPHICGHVFMNGPIKEPLPSLPRTPWGWKIGTALAYVIDFLNENGAPAYRIMYQDSAVNGCAFGRLPQELTDERPVDLAILCLGGFAETQGYPACYLDKLKPKRVFIAHWEDFFQPQTDPVKVVRRSPLPRFIQEIPKDLRPNPVILHAPGACEHIRIE